MQEITAAVNGVRTNVRSAGQGTLVRFPDGTVWSCGPKARVSTGNPAVKMYVGPPEEVAAEAAKVSAVKKPVEVVKGF